MKTMCKEADPVLEQYEASLDRYETPHERMAYQKNKCGYGLDGVCCKLCSNGPCRLSHSRPRGVCGADADTIAARNFTRQVAAGSACYIHVVENAAKQLKKIAATRGVIRSERALDTLCEKMNIHQHNVYQKAEAVADAILSDLYKPWDQKMDLTNCIAYPKRVENWKKLGIMPGGSKDEIFQALIKTSTNLNSDAIDLLMHCLRLGISTGVYGLVLTNLVNDVIMGDSEIRFDPVGLRVIDPDMINIMVTGHQHSFFRTLDKALGQDNIQEMAKAVGAKGIRLVGCTCVGQDFQVRAKSMSDAFCGHAGNNYTSEAVLSTGCIDLVVSEFNCTLPGIVPICDDLRIPQICIDPVAKKPNAEMDVYSYEKREAVTSHILSAAIASYQNRGEQGRHNPMKDHGYAESITGVTEVTLKEFLGGDYKGLIQLIAKGAIKGIAGVVGCSNLRAGGHDVLTVDLVKELIKRDILVLSAGCTCGGLENTGLMTREAAKLAGPNLRAVCEQLNIPPVLNFGPCLAIGRMELVAGDIAKELGVDIPDLPLVFSAPQWLEEQALADGVFALDLGLPLHLGLAPFVTGSDTIVQTLTEGLKGLTGGQLIIEPDAAVAASQLDAIIDEKRKGLGLS
ncbi:MAG: anaerobic carbon-monoxide dehydrogenase catalytic subunit [Pseudoramibacter sp.]